MLGLGGPELIIVLVLVMMVFGVGKLPQVGGSLGRGIREFKQGIAGRSEDDADSIKQLDAHSDASEQPS